jgi:hypothetical protein
MDPKFIPNLERLLELQHKVLNITLTLIGETTKISKNLKVHIEWICFVANASKKF